MLSTTLHYDKAIIHRAFRGFWWRTFGRMLIVSSLVLLAIGLGSAVYALGRDPWLIGMIGVALLFSCLCLALLTFIPVHGAMRRFIAAVPPAVTFTASENTFSFVSEAGVSEKHWSAAMEVWRLPSCWLLMFSKYQFSALPLADLTPELQTHIVAHVRAAGGRIR